MELRESLQRCKVKLFERMVSRVKVGVAMQFPEAAHALEKLEMAHTRMFVDELVPAPEHTAGHGGM